MFALDPKLQARLRQHMSRVLIVEDNQAYARMIADMLRVLGADNIAFETDDRKAMTIVEDLEPQLIISEYKNDRIDGVAFTRQLRHSGLRARAAPVILIKGDITPSQLTEARNCGAHEMLSKPFAWQDLFKRLQNVLFKPRDWIEVVSYTGPDRRRFNTGTSDYAGPKKRRNEGGAAKIALEEAVRLMRAALEESGDMMPTVLQQMAVIVPGCKSVKDPRFTQTVSGIINDLRGKVMTRDTLKPQVEQLAQSLGMNKVEPNHWAREMFVQAMADADAAETARSSDVGTAELSAA